MGAIMKLNKTKIYLTITGIVCLVIALLIYFNKAEDSEQEIKPTALVNITKVKKQEMVRTLYVNGIVNYAPDKVQQISFNTDVIVDQVFIQPGQKVKKGQILLKLSPSPSTRAIVDNAKISVDFSQKEYTRLNILRGRYLATNAEVQNAQQQLLKSQADLQSLLITINRISHTYSASTNGVVINVSAQAGQTVPAGTLLLSIGNKLQAQFNAPATYKDNIKLNQKIQITSLNNTNYTELSLISNISGQIDPISATIGLNAPLDISTGFISGDSITGKIYLDQVSQQLAIPKSALLYKGDIPYIFINKKGIAEQKWVTILYQNESTVYLSSGVFENEEVITSGNYELDPGTKLRTELNK